MTDSEVINIDKKRFLKIVAEWEKYGIVLFKKLSRNMPTSFVTDTYVQQFIIEPFAEKITMTELAEGLWLSMKPDACTVDEIHDEIYVRDQVRYFIEMFSDIESLTISIKESKYGSNGYGFTSERERFESPAELFVKLGKPAQLIIIQQGELDKALDNYKKAEQLIEKNLKEEINRNREWAKKNDISLKLKKEVRAEDKEQCVLCGRAYNYHSFGYMKTDDEIPKLDNVLLACNGCQSKRRKQIVKSEPVFGRFGE